MPPRPPVLVDTNVIIEAVRTECWTAITGQLTVETVEACRAEALAGSEAESRRYVPVGDADLKRMRAIHRVPPVLQAGLKLAYRDADGLDKGEHDLLAHAHARTENVRLCSPDKAAIRAAVALGLGDQIVSLEELIREVGARARRPLRVQFTTLWMVSFRSKVKLESM